MVRILPGEPHILALILLDVWPRRIAKPFVLGFESKLAPQLRERKPGTLKLKWRVNFP